MVGRHPGLRYILPSSRMNEGTLNQFFRSLVIDLLAIIFENFEASRRPSKGCISPDCALRTIVEL